MQVGIRLKKDSENKVTLGQARMYLIGAGLLQLM